MNYSKVIWHSVHSIKSTAAILEKKQFTAMEVKKPVLINVCNKQQSLIWMSLRLTINKRHENRQIDYYMQRRKFKPI